MRLCCVVWVVKPEWLASRKWWELFLRTSEQVRFCGVQTGRSRFSWVIGWSRVSQPSIVHGATAQSGRFMLRPVAGFYSAVGILGFRPGRDSENRSILNDYVHFIKIAEEATADAHQCELPCGSYGAGRTILRIGHHCPIGDASITCRVTGERSLRRLLIIGANSVIIKRHVHPMARSGTWLAGMLMRKPPMLVRVALANKMARIVWAPSRDIASQCPAGQWMVKNEVYRAPAAAA